MRPRLSEAERSRLGERHGAGVAQAGRRAGVRRPLPPFVWPPRGGSAARPRSSSATAGPAPGPPSPSASPCHPPRPHPPRRPRPPPCRRPSRVYRPRGPRCFPQPAPRCRSQRPVPSPGRARGSDSGWPRAGGGGAAATGACGARHGRVLPGAGGSAGRGTRSCQAESAQRVRCPEGCLSPPPANNNSSQTGQGAGRGRLREGLGKSHVLPLCFLSQC